MLRGGLLRDGSDGSWIRCYSGWLREGRSEYVENLGVVGAVPEH